jgi:hypothetical protein
VLVELLQAFGANTDPKLLESLFPADPLVVAAIQRALGEEAALSLSHTLVTEPEFIERISKSTAFKELCSKGLAPLGLLEYCVRFHALAAVEQLGSHRPKLNRAFKLLGAALRAIDTVPLERVARSAPRTFGADLLALKRFIRNMLDLQRGPFGIPGRVESGRPKEDARTNFMLRIVEVVPPDLWMQGRHFEREFADLHTVVFGKKIEPESYSRERKRHLQRAVARAKQVVAQEGRQKGHAMHPSHLQPSKPGGVTKPR